VDGKGVLAAQQLPYPLATILLPFSNPLLFVIPSVPGFPTSQLSPVPLMWFSSKRTTCSCSKPQPSTGNPGKPRDLQCAIRVPQIYRSTTTFPLSSRPERVTDLSRVTALDGAESKGLSRALAEGPRGCLSYPCRSDPFQPPKPALGGPATVFPWGREQELLASCYGRRLHLHSPQPARSEIESIQGDSKYARIRT
jgi:hypothetical protein